MKAMKRVKQAWARSGKKIPLREWVRTVATIGYARFDDVQPFVEWAGRKGIRIK